MRTTATVCKSFTFSAAHHLPHHDGLCRGQHGHTYKLEVMVTGAILEPVIEDPVSPEGMVVDFNEIKTAYREIIEPLVEHKDLNVTMEGLLPKVYVEDEDAWYPLTTCENLVTWMYWALQEALIDTGVIGEHYLRVRLWEGPTSYAQLPADRNGVDHA